MGPTPDRLLIVDDDPVIRLLLAELLATPGRDIQLAATGAEARSLVSVGPAAVVLLDIELPDVSGLTLLEEFTRREPAPTVIMITGRQEEESVITAMRRGAMDYVVKPIAADSLRTMVTKAFDLTRRIHESRALAGTMGGAEVPVVDELKRYMVGHSSRMFDLFKMIGRLAGFDLPVLVSGESGTGKELVARALHTHGVHRTGPFVPVDCGSMPAGLLEAELFGYERGAFTGAVAAKPGRFELADGGTLFLDEIGNIPLDLQAKLLRAVQEKTTQRLGSTRAVTWDARIISATNADLKALSAEGRFREDLMFRLAGVELKVPALRERMEDLPLLTAEFLGRWIGRKGSLALSPAATAALSGYGWPGNIRELEHVINRAAALAHGPVVELDDLPEALRRPVESRLAGMPVMAGKDGLLTLEEIKRQFARHALAACGGNKAETARVIGIDIKTLNSLLQNRNGQTV